jgi:hypothetical protein
MADEVVIATLRDRAVSHLEREDVATTRSARMADISAMFTIDGAAWVTIRVERTSDGRPAFNVWAQRAEDAFVIASRIQQPRPIESFSVAPVVGAASRVGATFS